MVESGGGYPPDWTSGVDGHGTVLGFSWLPWPLDEIKSRRDGPRTGNRHFVIKKVKFYSRSRKKVTVQADRDEIESDHFIQASPHDSGWVIG